MLELTNLAANIDISPQSHKACDRFRAVGRTSSSISCHHVILFLIILSDFHDGNVAPEEVVDESSEHSKVGLVAQRPLKLRARCDPGLVI